MTALPNDRPPLDAMGRTIVYRLRKMTDLITVKDHIVWHANAATLERIRFLFDQEEPRWTLKSLPDYSNKNPFLYFQEIPPSIRYKFLLDNTKYIIDNFVRSPVCIGSKATFAMDDYVWAWFVRPEADPTAQDSGPAAFTADDWDKVNDGYRVDRGVVLGEYALLKTNDQYLTRQELKLRTLRPSGMLVDDVWDGSCLFHAATCKGKNPNAWITALRHETNASVVFGGEGGNPLAIYLYNYSNFERMYYSLSFNYKMWGSLKHKVLTWRDFMHARIEAQDRCGSMLPQAARVRLRDDLNGRSLGEIGVTVFPDRSMGKEFGLAEVRKRIFDFFDIAPEFNMLVGVRPGAADLGFVRDLGGREAFLGAVGYVQSKRFAGWQLPPSQINSGNKTDGVPASPQGREQVEAAMKQVTQRYGFFNSRIPSVSYLRIVPHNLVYTLLSHRRYAARNFLSDSVWARRGQSDRDYSSVYRGIVGDYPNAFFEIPQERVQEFFTRLAKVSSDAEWLALRREFLVGKNSDNFWKSTDFYHSWMAQNEPVEGGILDLREYDNWEIPPESSGK